MYHVLAKSHNKCSTSFDEHHRPDLNSNILQYFQNQQQNTSCQKNNVYHYHHQQQQQQQSSLLDQRFGWFYDHHHHHVYNEDNRFSKKCNHCETYNTKPVFVISNPSSPLLSPIRSLISYLIPTLQASSPVVPPAPFRSPPQSATFFNNITNNIRLPYDLKANTSKIAVVVDNNNTNNNSSNRLNSNENLNLNCTTSNNNMMITNTAATVTATTTTTVVTTTGTASAHSFKTPSSSQQQMFTNGVGAIFVNSLQDSFILPNNNTEQQSSISSSSFNHKTLFNHTTGTTNSKINSNSNSFNRTTDSIRSTWSETTNQANNINNNNRLSLHRHSLIYDSYDQQPDAPSRSHSLPPSSDLPRSPFIFHSQIAPSLQQYRPSLILHQFDHLTLAEKERFEKLFGEIDINGNGFIDFNDLVHALELKGIKATHDNVKVCLFLNFLNLL